MFLYSFLLKWGRSVFLEIVLITVNVPGSVDNPTVNPLALVIPETLKVPLNPELPKPVLLLPLFILTVSTKDPTVNLCGCSVTNVAIPVE